MNDDNTHDVFAFCAASVVSIVDAGDGTLELLLNETMVILVPVVFVDQRRADVNVTSTIRMMVALETPIEINAFLMLVCLDKI